MNHNANIVGRFRTAVAQCDLNLHSVPQKVRRLIETSAWRDRREHTLTWKFEKFSEFVTASPVKGGMGLKIEFVEALLQKSGDADALTMWREATVGKHGGDRKSKDAPIKNDNIILDQPKPKQGTSRAYTLDRLKRERPDLFERVKAKELSANAAAIEAGFRKKSVRRCPHCGHEW
jgi:hypothetical protein